MSFSIAAYNRFSKAKNSTRRPPVGTNPDMYSCVMKEECSILHPVIGFKFDGGASYNPSGYNYFYIGSFDRYYFIVDWTWNNGLWWAELTVDVLASWKPSIMSTHEYVTRAADPNVRNVSVVDEFFPATFNVSNDHESLLLYDTASISDGTIVMGIADGKSSSVGGITYYCGKQNDYSQLFEFMYGSTDWINGAEIDDISNDLLKCLVDPAQYIKSLMWFPFNTSKIQGSASDNVGVGWWSTNVRLYHAKSTVVKSVSTYRPNHPQAGNVASYLNFTPYTYLYCVVPAFGTIPLPTEKFSPNDSITFSLYVDTVTGEGSLYIWPTSLSVAQGIVTKAQVGVPLSITSMKSDILGAAQAVTNGFSGGRTLVSSAIGAIGGVADAAKLISPDVSVIGGNGNISEYTVTGMLNGKFKRIVETAYADMGAPVCSEQLLGNLNGFIMVTDPRVDFSCYDQERDMIREYMMNGFYME